MEVIQRYSTGLRDKALEIGPGSGLYLPVLAKRFREVIAADIEDAYLNAANSLAAAHPNLHPVVDDITHSRLPERSFDLILCTEVVEHIADSARAIAEMHRLLKPGGVLILSTPQRYSSLELTAKIGGVATASGQAKGRDSEEGKGRSLSPAEIFGLPDMRKSGDAS